MPYGTEGFVRFAAHDVVFFGTCRCFGGRANLLSGGGGRDGGYLLPPHRPVLALLTHTVPTLDDDVADQLRRRVP